MCDYGPLVAKEVSGYLGQYCGESCEVRAVSQASSASNTVVLALDNCSHCPCCNRAHTDGDAQYATVTCLHGQAGSAATVRLRFKCHKAPPDDSATVPVVLPIHVACMADSESLPPSAHAPQMVVTNPFMHAMRTMSEGKPIGEDVLDGLVATLAQRCSASHRVPDMSAWSVSDMRQILGSFSQRAAFGGRYRPASQSLAFSLGQDNVRFYFPYIMDARARAYLWNAVAFQAVALQRPINLVEHVKGFATVYAFLDVDVNPGAGQEWSLSDRDVAVHTLRGMRAFFRVEGLVLPERVLLTKRVYPADWADESKRGKVSYHAYFPNSQAVEADSLVRAVPYVRRQHKDLSQNGVVDVAPLKNRGLSVPLTSKYTNVQPLYPVGEWDANGTLVDTIASFNDLFERCRLVPLPGDTVDGVGEWDAPPEAALVRTTLDHRTLALLPKKRKRASLEDADNGDDEGDEEWREIMDHTLTIVGIVEGEPGGDGAQIALRVGLPVGDPCTVLVSAGLFGNNIRQAYEKAITGQVASLRKVVVTHPTLSPTAFHNLQAFLQVNRENREVIVRPGYFRTASGDTDGWVSQSGSVWTHLEVDAQSIRRERRGMPPVEMVLTPMPGAPDPFVHDRGSYGPWVMGLLESVFGLRLDDQERWTGFNVGAAMMTVGAMHMLLNYQVHRSCGRDLPLVVLNGPPATNKTTLLQVLAHMMGFSGLAGEMSTRAAPSRFSHNNPGFPFLNDDRGKIDTKVIDELVQHSNSNDRQMATGVLRKRGGVATTLNDSGLSALSRDTSSMQRCLVIRFDVVDQGTRSAGDWRTWLAANSGQQAVGYMQSFWADVDLLEEDWEWAATHTADTGERQTQFMRLVLAETRSVFRSIGQCAMVEEVVGGYMRANAKTLYAHAHSLLFVEQAFRIMSDMFVERQTYSDKALTCADLWLDNNKTRRLFLGARALAAIRNVDAGHSRDVRRAFTETFAAFCQQHGGRVHDFISSAGPANPSALTREGATHLMRRGFLDVVAMTTTLTERRRRVARLTGNGDGADHVLRGLTLTGQHFGGMWLQADMLCEAAETVGSDIRQWGSLGAATYQLVHGLDIEVAAGNGVLVQNR